MTLEEAITWADNHVRNENLNYYVIKFNTEYCVVTTSHITRHNITDWVYTTEGKPEDPKFIKIY